MHGHLNVKVCPEPFVCIQCGFVASEAKGEANVSAPFNCVIVLRQLAIKKTKNAINPLLLLAN
jgi:hypothetical protein